MHDLKPEVERCFREICPSIDDEILSYITNLLEEIVTGSLELDAAVQLVLDLGVTSESHRLRHIFTEILRKSAAAWLLEEVDLHAAEAAWSGSNDAHARLEQEDTRRTASMRKQLLDAYAYRPVHEGSVSGKPGKLTNPPVVLSALGSTNRPQSKASQVRYRDGMKVTTKGEKYVTVSTKEEWDGGSKGRVYTKGKRGKGFT